MQKCQKCDWNTIGANYCFECGRPFMETCPICGKEEKRISIKRGVCEHLPELREEFMSARAWKYEGIYSLAAFCIWTFAIFSFAKETIGLISIVVVGIIFTFTFFIVQKKKSLKDIAEWEIEEDRLRKKSKPQNADAHVQKNLGGWGF